MQTKNINQQDSVFSHVTGESVFIDDKVPMPNELFVDFVGSSVAHGKITAIDLSAVKLIPDFVAAYTYKDLHENLFGGIIRDQVLLAETEVVYAGQPIVVVAAKTREALKAIKSAVKVTIQELKPILTIDEALEAKSFIGTERKIERGNAEEIFKTAPHILQGTFECKGQEHFYFETQSAIAYPLENDCLDILASTQHPTEVQHDVAEMLGLKQSQVVCTVKRIGGGFGGKESQNAQFAQMVALVAHKTKRPARIVLDRDDDFICTGKRHPFKNHYKVAFNNEGKILAYTVDINANGGAFADLSTAILERAMLHSANCYFIEHIRINARVARTHVAPNTAFRGFGAPQGIATIENVIEEIALKLNKDPLEIRQLNLYGTCERNMTPFGQVFENNVLPGIFSKLIEKSDYYARKKQIETHNKASKLTLKGISLCPVKFGISFTNALLNQGSALVNVQLDGSVQVSTGAIEMGQGVNTRIAQAVAQVFSIPHIDVKIMATSTEKNHNTSPTAASSGADINGNAAIQAAELIFQRLQHVAYAVLTEEKGEIDLSKSRNIAEVVFLNKEVYLKNSPEKKKSFAEIAKMAWLNRISLGEQAFYKTPGIWFDREKGTGNPFLYFTQGACVTEVEVDKFTGEVKVLASDIIMDMGKSLNEDLDKGQIVGAFIQGIGWCTTEDVVHNPKGILLSRSAGTYKIPSVQDFPAHFSVELFPNPQAIAGLRNSKAPGEPPLVLGLAAWTAIKNAIAAVQPVRAATLRLPASCEEVLLTLLGEEKLPNSV